MEAILKKEIVVDKALCRFLGVAAFSVLTALGAFVRAPLFFTPVPLTLQTFFVLLSGACLGSRMGALSQLGYLALGLAGLSVYSGSGSGPWYLCGPTGGYILGFALASFLAGNFIRRAGDNQIKVFLAIAAADLVLLACGTLWLKTIFGYSLIHSVLIGFIPFLPGDLLKAYAASRVYLKLAPRLKEIL